MIFADKLIHLRKKAGWSQEELAEALNVTRQSVSKWEGAHSIPELDKIILLSKVFGVSTDYLLKDEIEDHEIGESAEPLKKRVSMETANSFLEAKRAVSKPMAIAAFLCIISPIMLLLLAVLSEGNYVATNLAAAVGIITMLVLIAIAVAIFILCANKTSEFDFLDSESFETEYGVRGMIEERKKRFKAHYTKNNIIGTSLCILSLVPLFVGIALDESNDLLTVAMLCVMLLSVAVGIIFFVSAGVVWGSFERLLEEGDFSREKKHTAKATSVASIVYWLVAVSAFLLFAFLSNEYEYAPIILITAGILYPTIPAIVNAIADKK